MELYVYDITQVGNTLLSHVDGVAVAGRLRRRSRQWTWPTAGAGRAWWWWLCGGGGGEAMHNALASRPGWKWAQLGTQTGEPPSQRSWTVPLACHAKRQPTRPPELHRRQRAAIPDAQHCTARSP